MERARWHDGRLKRETKKKTGIVAFRKAIALFCRINCCRKSGLVEMEL